MIAASAARDWHAANRRRLAAALAEVREALELAAAPVAGEAAAAPAEAMETAAVPREPLEAAAASPDAPETAGAGGPGEPLSSLAALAALFDLSRFEQRVLLLCAGMELDASFAALCAAAPANAGRPYPTFGLALAAFPEACWEALSPDATLRRWRLIEVGPGDGLAASPLRVDERVLHYLLGVAAVDERLRGLLAPIEAADRLAPSQLAVAERIAALWRRAERAADCPVVQLCGGDAAGRRAIAAMAAARLGLGLWALDAADLPAPAAERETLALLWERESILGQRALLIESDEVEGTERARGLPAFVARVQGALLVSGRAALPPASRPLAYMEVDRPEPAEQAALWRQVLGAAGESLNGHVERVAAQFRLSPQAVRAAGAEVLDRLAGAEVLNRLAEAGLAAAAGPLPEAACGERRLDDLAAAVGPLLWEACRAQARPRLDGLAQRVEALATWEDLVLPAPQLATLRGIAAHVRQRARVYESWGFARKSARGLGLSALFSGASGTGKTMAAEVLAGELRLDLYRIDLAALVSKYIGETEKNLRRVFDAAEAGGAILLFDEADALFGKRSEVKDSHDRYANIEVSYLLQQVEAYRGLAILTSNLKNAVDAAFLRRLRFVVHFPFPDAAQRAEIWRRVFPPETPTEGLDPDRLARLDLSGGSIRNLAMGAAFLASDAGEPVRMAHLLRAARGEYAKLEKPLSAAEVGGWE